MNYPLHFRFKLIALAPQIYVEDASGQTVCYVKQKILRLREKVQVFTDSSQQQLLATIDADRIIDWSARYTFRDAEGRVIGAVGRRGLRSLWSAHYDVFGADAMTPVFSIREENPMAKVLDGLLESIPIVGAFTGFLLHPRYLAARAGGEPVLRLTKSRALFEGRFELTKAGEATPAEELVLILAFLMMNLLERNRG